MELICRFYSGGYCSLTNGEKFCITENDYCKPIDFKKVYCKECKSLMFEMENDYVCFKCMLKQEKKEHSEHMIYTNFNNFLDDVFPSFDELKEQEKKGREEDNDR